MSKRKQQHPTQILDNNEQEICSANSNKLLNTSVVETNTHENGCVINKCEQVSTYVTENSTLESDNYNVYDQELFSDDELELPLLESRIIGDDLYQLFNPFPKKRRKYIRGGEKICTVCGKITKSPSDLERHMRVHTGERPFHCIICHKPFKCKRSQQTHQYLCHDIADGLSQSRIELLNFHKKIRDVFNKSDVNNEVIQDDPEQNEKTKLDSTSLQKSVPQFHENVNHQNFRDSIETNCSILETNTSQHSIVNNVYVNAEKDGFLKQHNVDDVVQVYDEQKFSLPNVCIWNDSESFIVSSGEKELGEKSYLCELCGQDFNSFLHFHNHYQTSHMHINGFNNNNQHKCFEMDKNKSSSKITQVNPFSSSSVNGFLSQGNVLQDYDTKQYDPLTSKNIEQDFVTNCQPNKTMSIDMLSNNNTVDKQSDDHIIEHHTFKLPNTNHIINNVSNVIHSECIENQSFFPNTYLLTTSNTDNNSPFTWHSIKIHSEKVLITKLEGVHSTTEQQYVLYKCCLCGNSYPGMDMLCMHLNGHSRNNKEYNCEKCGAVFKWRSQLEVHDQVHRIIDGKIAMSTNMPSNYSFLDSVSNPEKPSSTSLITATSSSTELYNSVSERSPASSNFIASLTRNSVLESMTLPTSTEAENKNCLVPSLTLNKQRKNYKHMDSFQCKFCSKSFDRIFSLQRHERIHTGVKPCFCKVCGRGFSERRNLRHHIIRFHSDNNQRDNLRRSRLSGRQRTSNSSLRLVSFLKRTAVRILNSIDQSKFDIPMLNDRTFEESEFKQLEERHSKQTMENKINVDSPIEMDTYKDNYIVENDKITVVFPTDVLDCKPNNVNVQNSDLKDESREVLHDPKRSLIGNRRKGRPFKFNSVVKDISDESEIQISKLCNSKDDGLISLESCDSVLQDFHLSNFYGDSSLKELESFSNAEKMSDFSPEFLSSFKVKLQGHGAFFSSYNPRLGVISKPVLRTDVCKPRIGPNGQYVYPCGYCLKTFCSISDLNRHMDFHEDIRPFKCSYCDYYSRTNSQLKVHMMRHQGIKQFLCKICNYNGVTQSDLNRHCKTRTHLLRARHVCTWCKLGFYTHTLLDEHIRLFHPNEKEISEEVLLTKQTDDDQKLKSLNDKPAAVPSDKDTFLPHTGAISREQSDIFENNNYLKNLSL